MASNSFFLLNDADRSLIDYWLKTEPLPKRLASNYSTDWTLRKKDKLEPYIPKSFQEPRYPNMSFGGVPRKLFRSPTQKELESIEQAMRSEKYLAKEKEAIQLEEAIKEWELKRFGKSG